VNPKNPNPRLISLDFMRGLIMVLLMMESSQLFERITEALPEEKYWIMKQFFHHAWHGLRFWDLIQPGFMFIAGAALAYSLHRQQETGLAWSKSFLKVLKRSGWLFFWGVLDYAVRRDGLSFELWDVLTQLSFTTLVAFLIFRWSAPGQVAFSAGLLLLTEIIYRFTNVPGFDQPFTDQHNFGNYMDLVLMNKVNPGGWAAINCIPTACHTIWGALAGKLLLSTKSREIKIKTLFLWGAIILFLGYGLDVTFTPIIKRIATTSFVLVSGGWCLLLLACLFWWIDVRDHQARLKFFTIVGMNSLFIYLFFEIVGSRWFNGYIDSLSFGLFGKTIWVGLVSSSIIFALEWLMCWFFYKKNVFFKI
jgi:predicted acyltransferase